MDVSIIEFMELLEPGEDCVLCEYYPKSKKFKVVHIGPFEECMDLFEDGKHSIVRKSDLQAEYDRQQKK